MDRATRKELKSDKFVLEVQHGVDYVSEHRQSLIRWSVVGVVALLIVVGIYFYTRHESAARAEALQNAMQVVNAQVGAPNSPYAQTFPTQADKDKAEIKTFTDLAARYPGSNEGIIAEFYLGALNSEQGNIDAAIKHFKAVADSDRSYSTLG